jgi:predicted MFS family arabinose efflux permease
MNDAMKTTSAPNKGALAGATMALVLLTAMNFVNYLDRYILPAVQEQVKGEFHISDDQIGSLTTWFIVAYVCSSPFTGWLGDRFPRKPMIVVSAAAIALMNFFTAHVHDYMSLNIRHAALGVGEACFGVFAPAMIADYFSEERRNSVLTIFNIAIPVGAALGFTAGGWVAQHYSWRDAFVFSAVPGMLMAILMLIFLREPKRTGDSGGEHKIAKGALKQLATNKAYLGAILGYAAVTFSLGGISWWIASFLQRMNGMSVSEAGFASGAITAVAGLGGTVVGGIWANKWSKRTEKALYYVPAISAITAVPPALMVFFGPHNLTLVSLALAVFLIFLGTGPVNAATLNAVPANLRASAMAGQLLVIHVLGDAFSPKLIGIVSDRSNLRFGLGCTVITMVLAAIIFWIGAKFAPKLDHTVEVSAAA